jgi:hypothetical protein
MNLKLNLSISDQDLRSLGNLKITIAKPVDKDKPDVAWLVINPAMVNTIEWPEDYGIYASTTEYKAGAHIRRMSEKPPKVMDGRSYVFGKNGMVFDPGDDPCENGSFLIENLYDDLSNTPLTFGLTQTATVHDKPTKPSVINAAPVLYNDHAVFTPKTTVFVWLQSEYASGTVITQVLSSIAIVDFSGSQKENSLVYDSRLHYFVPAADGVAGQISIRKPALIY